MTKRLFPLLSLLAVSTVALAHEGHGVPGALPPPLHGGVIHEAEHKVAHTEDGKEVELFYEVVYKGKTLEVYPLGLPPENTTMFVPLSPKKDLKNVNLKVEFPRSKKTETLKPSLLDEVLKAELDAKGANRFIVTVNALHGNEEKTAKIQVVKD